MSIHNLFSNTLFGVSRWSFPSANKSTKNKNRISSTQINEADDLSVSASLQIRSKPSILQRSLSQEKLVSAIKKHDPEGVHSMQDAPHNASSILSSHGSGHSIGSMVSGGAGQIDPQDHLGISENNKEESLSSNSEHSVTHDFSAGLLGVLSFFLLLEFFRILTKYTAV
jgi:hypothetical protein